MAQPTLSSLEGVRWRALVLAVVRSTSKRGRRIVRQSSQASKCVRDDVPRGGDRVASRVRVAASACLVASGLFIGGAGGAMALADPGPGYGQVGRQSGPTTRWATSFAAPSAWIPATIRQARSRRPGQRPAGPAETDAQVESDEPRPRRRPKTDDSDRRPRRLTKRRRRRSRRTTDLRTTTTVSQPPATTARLRAAAEAAGGAIEQLPRFKPPIGARHATARRAATDRARCARWPGVLDAGAGAGRGARRRRGTDRACR